MNGPANQARTTLPRFTDRLALGDQGLRVSPFCLGLVQSADAVCAAFDAGINFFFLSADTHWPLYEASRRWLERLLSRGRGVRDQIVVAVASYATQPEFRYAPFEEVLEAGPGLGRIDVPIAGGAYGNEFPTRVDVYREPLDDEEQAYLMDLAAVAGGRAKVAAGPDKLSTSGTD